MFVLHALNSYLTLNHDIALKLSAILGSLNNDGQLRSFMRIGPLVLPCLIRFTSISGMTTHSGDYGS